MILKSFDTRKFPTPQAVVVGATEGEVSQCKCQSNRHTAASVIASQLSSAPFESATGNSHYGSARVISRLASAVSRSLVLSESTDLKVDVRCQNLQSGRAFGPA